MKNSLKLVSKSNFRPSFPFKFYIAKLIGSKFRHHLIFGSFSFKFYTAKLIGSKVRHQLDTIISDIVSSMLNFEILR